MRDISIVFEKQQMTMRLLRLWEQRKQRERKKERKEEQEKQKREGRKEDNNNKLFFFSFPVPLPFLLFFSFSWSSLPFSLSKRQERERERVRKEKAKEEREKDKGKTSWLLSSFSLLFLFVHSLLSVFSFYLLSLRSQTRQTRRHRLFFKHNGDISQGWRRSVFVFAEGPAWIIPPHVSLSCSLFHATRSEFDWLLMNKRV